MSLEQLVRDTMREHAADVETGVPGLGARARAQADATRSRRQAAAGAAVLAVVAVFSVLAVNPFGSSQDDVEPAGSGESVPVRTEFAGRTLIETAQTTDGRFLELTATPSGGSEWHLACTGVGSSYVVHYALNGATVGAAPCSPFAELGKEPAPGVASPGYRIPTSGGGERRTLRMWVTEAGGPETVEPDGAVLVAAVYAMPAPLAELAGFELLQVEEALGQEWSVVEYGGSEPGEQSYTLDLPAHPQETVLQLFASGSGTAVVRLTVDGRPVSTEPSAYPLGTANIGDLLSPGEAHTVTLRIEGAVPDDAVLGIVQRERAS